MCSYEFSLFLSLLFLAVLDGTLQVQGCERMISRVDIVEDHVRRIYEKHRVVNIKHHVPRIRGKLVKLDDP